MPHLNPRPAFSRSNTSIDRPNLAPRFRLPLAAFALGIGLTLGGGALSTAGELLFETHVINTDSQFMAAAALDVNHDGQIDIVCGEYWYEGPNWQRHRTRDVPIIRGRPDGYAHIAEDINRDGWTDVLIINFRSRSIQWAEHPGESLGEWPLHVVEEPGSMETGRLFDIDNDGRLDILPNGSGFAAWWSIDHAPAVGGRSQPIFTRHELPQQMAGHGVGAGDINGDGRTDIVGAHGWAEAPADAKTGAWTAHNDFELGRASVPILVVDVDQDGDNDLVWCNGHDYGTYWMEHAKAADGSIQWTRHTIDAAFSGGHSPLWADMDGDGRNELVVGKRYLPHEGRDPGEYDPMTGYRYQFDPATRTWHRWVLSYGKGVGYGLDPKVVDLDGDGDLDMLTGGRHGLYWLENTGAAPTAENPADDDPRLAPSYADRNNLLVVKDADGTERPIETKFDMGLRRAHILANAQQVMGPLPSSHDRAPLQAEWGEPDANGARTVTFTVAPGTQATATLMMPTTTADSPRPAAVVLQYNNSPVAAELLAQGFVCLVHDSTRGPQQLNDAMRAGVWKTIRSVDLLETLPEVDPRRITAVGSGHNGATMAIVAAAFDARLRGVLASPPVESLGSGQAVDLPELAAAIAPRPLFIRCPAEESLPGLASLPALYEKLEVPSAYRRMINQPGESFSDEHRADALSWFAGQFE